MTCIVFESLFLATHILQFIEDRYILFVLMHVNKVLRTCAAKKIKKINKIHKNNTVSYLRCIHCDLPLLSVTKGNVCLFCKDFIYHTSFQDEVMVEKPRSNELKFDAATCELLCPYHQKPDCVRDGVWSYGCAYPPDENNYDFYEFIVKKDKDHPGKPFENQFLVMRIVYKEDKSYASWCVLHHFS